VVTEVLVPEVVAEVLVPEMVAEVLVPEMAAEALVPEMVVEVLVQQVAAEVLDQALDLEEEVKGQELDLEAVEVNRACTAERKRIRSNSHMMSSRCSRTEDSSVYDSSSSHSSRSNILRN
jgi:hypothetical protein